MEQKNLRKFCKMCKALNDDIFTYKDLAEMLDMSVNSFYNWLNGTYNLGYGKSKALENFLNDIAE
ncbi:MAG: helix-turn-helix transcriptional regulator [Clostridia bacterium]|nr:helix-turn-helix transcriptional regulator [Clostridia bacterium]MBP3581147.1 helix-turn-helix transcriptional regulator [Clostridia bacterium]MBP3681427.1 helix-turn-helix transcriptional regulator [Clostridia bacterium]